MNHADAETMTRVGSHLAEVLLNEGEKPYSHFYNDKPGRTKALNNACGLAPDEENAHCFVEWAARQLESQGYATITELPDSELIDGEPDFLIRLTEQGRSRLERGQLACFRAAELSLWFSAHPASEWLINFLYHGGPGQKLTLRDVMEYGDSEAELAIPNHEGCDFRWGSEIYAWAFEISLWHHARLGHIEPVFKDDKQRSAWEEFFRQAGEHIPSRTTDVEGPHPLWDVPFRLAGGVTPENVQFVDRIVG
jgi:hypothetical protein